MTNKQYIIAIIVVTALIIILGIIFMGAYAQIIAPCENCEKLIQEMEAEIEYPKSYGEIGKETYTVEIWDDGTAKVKTLQGYIQEPEDGVLIITNRAMTYDDGEIKLY